MVRRFGLGEGRGGSGILCAVVWRENGVDEG